MSNTVRKARDINRTPRVRGNIKESFKAKEEVQLLGYKASNRIKVRSNLINSWTDKPCSGYKESYISKDLSKPNTQLDKLDRTDFLVLTP